MKVNRLFLKCTFDAPCLGTSPSDPDLLRTQTDRVIAKLGRKAGDLTDAKLSEELAVAAAQAEHRRMSKAAAGSEAEEARGTTVFACDDIGMFGWDYWFRGFLKESLASLVALGDADGVTEYNRKMIIDRFVFVKPRRIYLRQPGSNDVWQLAPDTNERPIRIEVFGQAPRTAIARSEEVPAGTWFATEIRYLTPGDSDPGQDEKAAQKRAKKIKAPVDEALIKSILDYGQFKGLGQWRSGGWGAFTYEVLPDDKLIIPASSKTMSSLVGAGSSPAAPTNGAAQTSVAVAA